MILATNRLTVREFDEGDAAFILGLLNEPSFIEHIGDKGVRNLDDARQYLQRGPLASYRCYGHGLWRVGLKLEDAAIGMAGILRREGLDHVDLGYAFLPEYCGQGYALEVTSAVMKFAREELDCARVLAIVSERNHRSIHLLGKLGFNHERLIRLGENDEDSMLFAWDAAAGPTC